jgi:N-acetylmuramoyl-L-alanine amidase
MRLIVAVFFLNLYCFASLQSQEYVKASPLKGQGISSFLSSYDILPTETALNLFYDLNSLNSKKPVLYLNAKYQLPIRVFKFNGKNIRTTIGIDDYNSALMIQRYNEAMLAAKKRTEGFRTDKRLWVPIVEYTVKNNKIQPPFDSVPNVISSTNEIVVDLFGDKYKDVEVESKALKGVCFYLVAGHGGPDPGAIGKHAGNTLHEDEYAYDVILRLGRKLIENGAEVHFIIQDDGDGIRDDIYLNNSKDETCMGEKIPLNQVARLKQRVNKINELYDSDTGDNYAHQFISIHVDSRLSKDSQIDVFFYHAEGSVAGERVADALRDKMEEKYRAAQPGRGYKGSVKHRGLYVIRKTKPVSTFIELGNIQNPRDQKRILHPDNRQAIANWLTEGLIEYYSE